MKLAKQAKKNSNHNIYLFIGKEKKYLMAGWVMHDIEKYIICFSWEIDVLKYFIQKILDFVWITLTKLLTNMHIWWG